MLARSAAVVSLVVGAGAVVAQPAHWVGHADGQQHMTELAEAVAHGPLGTVSITGKSQDGGGSWSMITARFAADGTRLWTQQYRTSSTGFHNDAGIDVGVDDAGNTYAVGGSYGGDRPGGTDFDYVLVKYSPLGDVVWTRRFNGPGNWSDEPSDMVVDGAGNCYIAGFSLFQPDLLGRYATDFHVIKYTSSGDVAWQYHTNNPANGNLGAGARSIALDPMGNVYATGIIQGGDQWNSNNDILTVKLTNAGQLVWRRQYSTTGANTGDDDSYTVAADGQGNCYVGAGYMNDDSARHRDALTMKYSPTGQLLWTVSTSRVNEERPMGIVVDSAGRVFVGGGWLSPLENNGWVEAYSASGGKLWEYVVDEAGDYDENWVVGVRLAPDGSVWAGADNQRPGATGYDPTLLKFAPSGQLLYRESFDAGSTSDSTFSFDIDQYGNAYLGGHSAFAAGADLTVVKVIGGPVPPPCGTSDFNGDGDVGTDQDIEAFFACLGGACCATCYSGGADFNGDGDVGTDQDIESFFRVLGGGAC